MTVEPKKCIIQNTLSNADWIMSDSVAYGIADIFGGVEGFNSYCEQQMRLIICHETKGFSDEECVVFYDQHKLSLLNFVRSYARSNDYNCGFDWIDEYMSNEGFNRDETVEAMYKTNLTHPRDVIAHMALSILVVRLAGQELVNAHQSAILDNSFCENIKKFLANLSSTVQPEVSCDAVLLLIKKVGGEDDFLRLCSATCKHSSSNGVTGFLFADDRIDFYLENKAALLDFMQAELKEVGFKSIISHISTELNEKLYGTDKYTLDDIAVALYGTAVENTDNEYVQNDVSSFIVYRFIDKVCQLYRQSAAQEYPKQ